MQQMEPWQLEIGYVAARYWWALGLGVSAWAVVSYRSWARRKYLEEALERFVRVDSSRLTAQTERVTSKMLNEFLDAPPPTLGDLVSNIDEPFSLKP